MSFLAFFGFECPFVIDDAIYDSAADRTSEGCIHVITLNNLTNKIVTRKSVALATCEENWARINMNIPPFSENALALFFIQSTILQLLAG